MKTIYLILFTISLANLSIAQSSTDKTAKDESHAKLVANQESSKSITSFAGVNELNAQLKKHLKLPSVVQEFNLEGKILVRVKLDEKGKILDTKIVKGLDESVDKSILKALAKIEKVEPIVIGGKATAKTVELSVLVKP